MLETMLEITSAKMQYGAEGRNSWENVRFLMQEVMMGGAVAQELPITGFIVSNR
jgi:hypothetical protein